MKGSKDNVIKTTTSLFLDNVKDTYEDKVILQNEHVIILDQKHSIRKWVKQNTDIEKNYSRRICVELSRQIDTRIRYEIKRIQQKLVQQKCKEIKKRYIEFMKQIKKAKKYNDVY